MIYSNCAADVVMWRRQSTCPQSPWEITALLFFAATWISTLEWNPTSHAYQWFFNTIYGYMSSHSISSICMWGSFCWPPWSFLGKPTIEQKPLREPTPQLDIQHCIENQNWTSKGIVVWMLENVKKEKHIILSVMMIHLRNRSRAAAHQHNYVFVHSR